MNNIVQYKKAIIVGTLTILSLIGGGIVYSQQPSPPPLEIILPTPTVTATQVTVVEIPEPDIPTATPQPTNTPQPLRVYVTGEVNTSDVYILPPGSIVKDAIVAAGGATEKADLAAINQALELQDQQQIHVPALSDNAPAPPPIGDGVVPVVEEKPASVDNDTNAVSSSTQPTISGKININTANITELDSLPGIGPAIAQRIIDHREAQGSFNTIQDLTEVKGIGSATLEKLSDYIVAE